MIRASFAVLTATLAVAPLCHPAWSQPSGGGVEQFNTPWAPSSNPNSYGEPTDGWLKADGNYCVPYGVQYTDELNTGNVIFSSDSLGSILNLVVRAGTHYSEACGTTAYGAAEIATNAGWQPGGPGTPPPFGPSNYGYGFYETRMKPSCVQGQVSSFFWIQAPSYGPLEIDLEFPNPPGHDFNDVHFTIHPSGQTAIQQLGFNPCASYHRYGFLWTAGKVVFTVDGQAEQTFSDSSLDTGATGFVMANAWTGNPNWGGGPPSEDAVNSYRWMRFQPNATTIPDLPQQVQ